MPMHLNSLIIFEAALILAVAAVLLLRVLKRRSFKLKIAAFESVFENMPGGVIVVDKNGKFLIWNPSVKRILGKEPANIPSSQWAGYFGCYQPDRKTIVPAREFVLSRAMRSELVDGVEMYVWNDKVAGETWVIATARPLRDEKGNLNGGLAVFQDITLRKRAELAQAESEEKFRKMAGAAQDAIIMIDDKGKITYWNEAAIKIFGYSAEEAMGKELHSFVAPEHYREAYRRGFKKFSETGEGNVIGTTLVLEALRKGGPKSFSMELSISSLKLGGRWHAIGIVRDISERKRVSEELVRLNSELEEKAQNYKALVSNIPGAIYRCACDPDRTMEFMSDAIRGISGYLAGDFIGSKVRSYASVIHPEDRPLVGKKVKEGMSAKIPFEVEYRIVHADGSVRWVYEKGQGVFDAHDNALWLDGAIFDVTESKKVEEAFLRTEWQQKAILNNIPDIAWLKDRESRFVAVNEPFAKACGKKAEDLPGKTDLDVWPGDLAERYVADDLSVMQSGRSKQFEEPLADVTGSIKWIETIKTPVYNDKKEIIGTTGIARDITERKKTEQSLAKLNECFLSFGADPDENIGRLVDLLGELLNATCAFYNRIEGAKLCTISHWNAPPDYVGEDEGAGHICYDVAQKESNEVYVVKNLQETPYARTDPNVLQYHLKTYVGQVVRCSGVSIGTLCAVYVTDFDPAENDKKLMGIVAIAIGVEELRKRAEDEIRKLKQQIEFILGATRTGLDIIDSECNIIYVDPEWEKVYGDYRGRKCYEYFMGRDGVCPGCGIPKALKSKSIVVTEETLVKENNRPIQVTTIPFQNDRGEWFVAEVNVDITERKDAEEALRRQEEHFRSLIENALDIITVLDADGTIKFESPSIERILGYKPEELVGKKAFDFVCPEDIPGLMELFSKGIRDRGVITAEFRFQAKDGSWHILEGIGENLLDDAAVRGLVVNCRDITERKRAQESLIQKTAELTRANADREQLELFAVLASHDLREPLQKILGLVDLLKTHTAGHLDEKGLDYLERVENASIRMNQIIGDLLQFSRAATATKPFGPVALNEVFCEALTDLELQIAGSRARIDIGILPAVQGDKFQLRQIFQNLISNAIKFAKSDEAPHVVVESRLPGDGTAEISVKDNGIGFDEKYLDRIFKPFERLHSRSEYEGSGMGLAICQKIALRHKGKITARSVPNAGATFIVTLPLA